MNLTIAGPADLERIVRLVNDAYRGSSKTPGWTHEAALVAGQRTDVAALRAALQAGAAILVMKEATAIVACVEVRPLDSDEWYLSMLAVDPDHQSGGLGRKIMAGAEQFAREHGARQMKISVVNLRAPLLAWYERVGYVQTGAVEPFPYDDASVGTALRRDLALVTLMKKM